MVDQNLIQFKAESQEISFTITDDDGNILDLTNPSINNVYLVVSTALHQYGEIQFDVTADTVDDTGVATFLIKPSQTEDLRPGNYLYEVYVQYQDSDNYVAEVGKFFVKPRVDR